MDSTVAVLETLVGLARSTNRSIAGARFAPDCFAAAAAATGADSANACAVVSAGAGADAAGVVAAADATDAAGMLPLLAAFGARVDAARPDFTAADIEAALADPPAGRSGRERIDYARAHMPCLAALAAQYREAGETWLDRVGIAANLIIEPKTAVFVMLLHDLGARIALCCNASASDAAVIKELSKEGIAVYANRDNSPTEDLSCLHAALGYSILKAIIDDGAGLARVFYQKPPRFEELRGICEETTSGVKVLEDMAAARVLKHPAVAVNDIPIKTDFDNVHGTAETVLFTTMHLLGVKTVLGLRRALLFGYGAVGRGIAKRLAAMGLAVTVSDPDPVAALRAIHDGFSVQPGLTAAKDAMLVISASGEADTVSAEILAALPDGAVVLSAGGTWQEIALEEIRKSPDVRWDQRDLDRCRLNIGEKKLTVLSRGLGVNYTSGDGNAIEIMDLSFAGQFEGLRMVLTQEGLAPGVHRLPAETAQRIADIRLAAMGIPKEAPPRKRDWTRTRFSDIKATSAGKPRVTLYSADWAFPVRKAAIREGAVLVKDGKIAASGTRAELRRRAPEAEEIHLPGALLPGLVNGHTHLQYTGMADLGQRTYKGMKDWALAFNAVYDAIPKGEGAPWKAWAEAGAQQLIRSGTTAAADFITDTGAFTALVDAGLGGLACLEFMGLTNKMYFDGEWEAWEKKFRAFVEIVRVAAEEAGSRAQAAMGPHACYSLDALPIQQLVKLAYRMDLRSHMHIGEAPMEAAPPAPGSEDGFGARFGASEFYKNQFSGDPYWAGGSVNRMEHWGVLGPWLHIAHGIYIDENGRKELRGRRVGVCLCPRSNAVIGLAEAPVRQYLQEGSLLALGTDSLSSSPSLDILAEAAAFVALAKKQGYSRGNLHKRTLEILTVDGARCLGAGIPEVGYPTHDAWHYVNRLKSRNPHPAPLGLIRGAHADLCCIRAESHTETDVLAEICEDGAGKNIATVIGGKPVYMAAGSDIIG
ncbi:MAG: adenosylhomocysteinase [Clostridiales Family XIII bacterium]|jgi:adenosylhomocysteinase|nr:adenosylhomocysteinase [Clostridiales Family XIII bacterium]